MASELVCLILMCVACVSAIGVISAAHPVKSVLFLVLAFVATAGIWMLLEAEFLSLVLIVVYVGAVMVLFLFVVMMLNVERSKTAEAFVTYWPFALAISIVFAAFLIAFVAPMTLATPVPDWDPNGSNVLQIGLSLFSDHLYPFEIAAVILLSAMVAAIALTFRGRRPNEKAQVIREQVKVKARDRLTLIDMPYESGEEN